MFCVIEWPLSVNELEEGRKVKRYVLPLQVH